MLFQQRQLQIVDPKIVPPLGDAVRFVDGKQCDRDAVQQFNRRLLIEAFGGDVKQVEIALAQIAQHGTLRFRGQ